MSINQNIARISQAKSDIKAAIIAKGGTVGDSATIDEYADAIEALPSGGGSNERKNELILSSSVDGSMVYYYDDSYTNVINGICSYNGGDWSEDLQPQELNIGDRLVFRFDAMVADKEGYPEVGYLHSDQPYSLNVAGTIYVSNMYEYVRYGMGSEFQDVSNLNIIIDREYGDNKSACVSMFDGNTQLTDTPNITVTGDLDRGCCDTMFGGCSDLKNIHLSFEDETCTLGVECMICMFGDTGVEEFVMPQFGFADVGAFSQMFTGCTSLRYAEFPDADYEAGVFDWTFYECPSLQTFVIRATTPPTIDDYTFYNCPDDMTIYVPDASVDAYKAEEGWSARADYIRPISEKPSENPTE